VGAGRRGTNSLQLDERLMTPRGFLLTSFGISWAGEGVGIVALLSGCRAHGSQNRPAKLDRIPASIQRPHR
jgi:hypothetical protein